MIFKKKVSLLAAAVYLSKVHVNLIAANRGELDANKIE